MIYEYAGICGVNPEPFTLRELRIMTEGKQKADWDRTSSVLAMYLNAHISRRTYSPAELNPYRAQIVDAETPPATAEQTRQALKAFAGMYQRK